MCFCWISLFLQFSLYSANHFSLPKFFFVSTKRKLFFKVFRIHVDWFFKYVLVSHTAILKHGGPRWKLLLIFHFISLNSWKWNKYECLISSILNKIGWVFFDMSLYPQVLYPLEIHKSTIPTIYCNPHPISQYPLQSTF